METFRRFFEIAEVRLRRDTPSPTPVDRGKLRVFLSRSLDIQERVDGIESTSEFQDLVNATKIENPEHGIRNFFRRSGCYLDLYENKHINIALLQEQFQQNLHMKQITITCLACLQYVSFREEVMDFGNFQIRRFKREELEGILNNRVSSIFYPAAHLDLDNVMDYWFIYTKAPKGSLKKPILIAPGETVFEREFSNFPPALESIIKQISLYDWEAHTFNWHDLNSASKVWKEFSAVVGHVGWHIGEPFCIPFLITVNDNLFNYPDYHLVGDIPIMEMEMDYDPATDEIIETERVVYYNFDEEKTLHFKNFVQKAGHLLSILRTDPKKTKTLEFVEIAMGCFLKAFLSRGLEQLLWHITTLEALLGEREKDSTKRLGQRISIILGENEEDKRVLEDAFDKIYDFRCRLVHGRRFKKRVRYSHMAYARFLARSILMWFLTYLYNIGERSGRHLTDGKFPSRKNLLATIDLGKKEDISLGRF